MNCIIIFTALFASTIASPVYYLDTQYHTPVKSTLTKSSQLVDHGSTSIVHAPVIPVHSIPIHTTAVHSIPVHTTAVHSIPVHYSVPVSSKTTITKNSQLVNHGGHEIIHTVPVVHQPVHTYVHEPVHIAHLSIASHAVPVKTKTTVTKNSQLVNHGGQKIVELTHEDSNGYKNDLATSSQFFKLDNDAYTSNIVYSPSRTGDSAVSHQSSTVHETVAEVKHLPLYTLHH